LKPRVDDPKIQKSFDAIIERLEVLDGLRGDILDKAVTYRELGASGFVFGPGGGIPPIINTPGPGDGGSGGTPVPGTGPPSKAPDTLSATETFLAILLSWVSYQNVAYTEVWRSIPNPDPDNPDLSTAVRIATSRLGKWVDYVGASVCYWYWVRDVGTDGSFSAYSEPAYACTGIDPRDFEFELNISAQQLDDALNARIDLIDVPGVIDSLMNRVGVLQGESLDYEERITELRVDTDTITNITIPGLDQKIDGNAQIVEQQYAKITYVDNQDGLLDDRLGDAESTLVIQSGKILALEANIGVLDTDSGKAWDFTGTNEGFTASGGTIKGLLQAAEL
jgi:hypothetical protein